jgi:heme-degrading monooxygenase HmoA
MECTIRVDSAVTTLINVFTVEPGNQPRVLALLEEGIAALFSSMPGWISASLLKSRDGRQVIAYSQWRDEKDIDAFRRDPRMQAYSQRSSVLAKHDAFTCDVSYSVPRLSREQLHETAIVSDTDLPSWDGGIVGLLVQQSINEGDE